MAIFLGANVAQTYTTLSEGNTPALGDIYEAVGAKRFVFVQYGTGGATANYAVSITHAGAAVMTTNALSLRGERVGVAMATAVANEYGWAQIYGAVNVQTDLAVANAAMATTVTAGQIDDASGVGTKQILGLVLTTAKAGSAGLAPCFMSWATIGITN